MNSSFLEWSLSFHFQFAEGAVPQDQGLARYKTLCDKINDNTQVITLDDFRRALASQTGRVPGMSTDLLDFAINYFTKTKDPTFKKMKAEMINNDFPFLMEKGSRGLFRQRIAALKNVFLLPQFSRTETLDFNELLKGVPAERSGAPKKNKHDPNWTIETRNLKAQRVAAEKVMPSAAPGKPDPINMKKPTPRRK